MSRVFGHDFAGLHSRIGVPMFKQSQSSILASMGDSIGSPTRQFLLASTADSIVTRPTRRFLGKAEQNLQCVWQFFVLVTACSEEAAVVFGTLSHCRLLTQSKQL